MKLMYIGLEESGKYVMYTREKDMILDRQKYKYLVMDISTGIKGPLHTIVKSKDIHSLPDSIDTEITIDLDRKDSPIDHVGVSKNHYPVKSYSTLYAIIANIYQYDKYNAFIAEESYEMGIGDTITIGDIKIRYNISSEESIYFHYYYDVSCDFYERFIKQLNLRLYTTKVFGDCSYIEFDKNGYWYTTDKISNNTKYVGMYIHGTKSFYILSKKLFERIEMVDGGELSLGHVEYDNLGNADLVQLCTFAIMGGRDFILPYLLFIPQYVLLYGYYLNGGLYGLLNVTSNGKDYEIECTDYEMSKYGFSLFKIIKSVTKI